jgi:hypothetical protein
MAAGSASAVWKMVVIVSSPSVVSFWL